jgi:hypothetical protein
MVKVGPFSGPCARRSYVHRTALLCSEITRYTRLIFFCLCSGHWITTTWMALFHLIFGKISTSVEIDLLYCKTFNLLITFYNKIISLILSLIFYRDFQNNSLSNLSNSLSPPTNVTILYAFLFNTFLIHCNKSLLIRVIRTILW